MAETVGLVQELHVFDSGVSCFWIGPTPTITEVLIIQRDSSDAAHVGAFKNSMVDALTSAHFSRQEVIAGHPDDNAGIVSVRFEP